MSTNSSPVQTLPADEHHLRVFERRLQLVRDRVSSVTNHYQPAVYIVGRPGTGKTYTVVEELKRLTDEPWALRSGRMTPVGFLRFLSEHPEHTLVLDDVSGLFENPVSRRYLMAALDGRADRPREIAYQSRAGTEKVEFRGGIIAISNLPLNADPIAQALGSRMVILQHEPSDEEVAAYMRHLVAHGYCGLAATQALEVVDFLVCESNHCGMRLDLRSLAKAAQDYRQFSEGRSQTHWHELVRSTLSRLHGSDLLPARSKKQELQERYDRVSELMQTYPDDTSRQLEESGLSKSTFYGLRRAILHGQNVSAASGGVQASQLSPVR